MSWLTLREDGVVALALDRRGRAYENARSDPRASLEVFDVSGGLAVRGWLTVTNRVVRAAPFDCALAILDVKELRDHGLRSVVFEPPRYSYGPGKSHYERVEKTIIRELRAAPISQTTDFPGRHVEVETNTTTLDETALLRSARRSKALIPLRGGLLREWLGHPDT